MKLYQFFNQEPDARSGKGRLFFIKAFLASQWELLALNLASAIIAVLRIITVSERWMHIDTQVPDSSLDNRKGDMRI